MEEWPDDGDPKELRLEVKAGEEVILEHLIRFCYSKQVTVTEGQQLALCILPKQRGAQYMHAAFDLTQSSGCARAAEKSLLRLIQLADCLLMTECVDVCVAALTPEVSPV